MNEEQLGFIIKEWYFQESSMREHYDIQLNEAKIQLEKELKRKPEWHEKLSRYMFNLFKEFCPNEYSTISQRNNTGPLWNT